MTKLSLLVVKVGKERLRGPGSDVYCVYILFIQTLKNNTEVAENEAVSGDGVPIVQREISTQTPTPVSDTTLLDWTPSCSVTNSTKCWATEGQGRNSREGCNPPHYDFYDVGVAHVFQPPEFEEIYEI